MMRLLTAATVLGLVIALSAGEAPAQVTWVQEAYPNQPYQSPYTPNPLPGVKTLTAQFTINGVTFTNTLNPITPIRPQDPPPAVITSPFPNWTFINSGVDLNNNVLTIKDYEAKGINNSGARAVIDVYYTPGQFDPPHTSSHWVQVVYERRDYMDGRVTTNTILDHNGNILGPWYDFGNATATPANLFDAPARVITTDLYSLSWRADLFLFQDMGNNVGKFWQGFSWGFHVLRPNAETFVFQPVPEPSSAVLGGIAGVMSGIIAWNKRRRASKGMHLGAAA